MMQQAGADGDQCVIAIPAGGKGVGRGVIEDADFGPPDPGAIRLGVDGFDQPAGW